MHAWSISWRSILILFGFISLIIARVVWNNEEMDNQMLITGLLVFMFFAIVGSQIGSFIMLEEEDDDDIKTFGPSTHVGFIPIYLLGLGAVIWMVSALIPRNSY